MEPVEIAAGAFQLQPWAPHDAQEVFAACQDPDIQRWTRVPSPYSLADAELFVGTISPAGWREGTGASFAVKDATTGRLLASVGLHGISPRDRSAELGYWAAPWARGEGVTTAGSRAVCRWAFDSGLVDHIQWLAEVGNDASRRIAAKLGFVEDGILRARLLARGGVRADAWHATLLKGELR